MATVWIASGQEPSSAVIVTVTAAASSAIARAARANAELPVCEITIAPSSDSRRSPAAASTNCIDEAARASIPARASMAAPSSAA